MLSTAQGLKDLTGNVHIDTLECRNLSATNFDISNLAVATSLLPTQDNVVDLGSSAKRFKRAYVNDIDLGVARASKQLKTDASGVVAFDPLLSVGTGNGLTLNAGTQVLDLATASASTTGALTSTDWSTFNGKANTSGYTPNSTIVTNNVGQLSTAGCTSSQLTALANLGLDRVVCTSSLVPEVATSNVTVTELGYLSGVTSAVQTQLNGKEPSISLTVNRAVASDGSGKLTTSTTTATELSYLNGVTSAVQTQLNTKQVTLFVASTVPGANIVEPISASPHYTLKVNNDLWISGNTGLGNTAPAARLHVSGDSFLESTSGNGKVNPVSGQLVLKNTSGRLVIGDAYVPGVETYAFMQASDYYSGLDHPQSLLLNPLGGNVGIGMNSAGAKLHVDGTVVTQRSGAYCTKIPIDLSFALWGTTYKVKLNAYQYGPRVRFEMSGYGGSGTAHIYQRYVWAARADGNASGYANWDVNQSAGLLSISYSASEYACTFTYYGNNNPSLFAEFEYLGPDPNPTVSIT